MAGPGGNAISPDELALFDEAGATTDPDVALFDEPSTPAPKDQGDPRDLAVDTRAGGPFKLQAGVAGQPDQREQDQYLEKTLGEYGKLWRKDARGRYVVRKDADPSKGETLLFPEGFEPVSIAARAVGDIPRTAAAVAGGIAGSAGGPVGAVAGATAAETLVETGRRQYSRDEPGPSFGAEAVPVGAESLFANTLGEVLGGVGGRMLSPFGRGAADPERQLLRGAAERLLERTKLQVPNRRGGLRNATPEDLLNAGELTGSRSFERLLAIVDKHPGTNLYKDSIAQDAAMVSLRRHVGGDPVDAELTGDKAVSILQKQFDEDVKYLDAADKITEDLTGNRIAMSGQGPRMGPVYFVPVFAHDAADLSRRGYSARREAFRMKENELGGRVQNAPGGLDKIVSTEPVVKKAEELYGKGLRAEGRDVPTGLLNAQGKPIMGKEEGAPLLTFIPPEVKSDLMALMKAEPQTTIEAMRRLRQHIYSAIENPESLGGFGQGDLKQLATATTVALHDAENAARAGGNERLADAMFDLRDHHSKNIDKFSERGVLQLSKRSVDPGEQSPLSLFVNPAKSGDVEVLKRYREFFGGDSVEWSANVSSVWNQLITDARDPISGKVDAKKLAESMQTLRTNGSANVLFGEPESREISGALNTLAAQQRYIDPKPLQGSSDPLLARIATTRALEKQATTAYKSTIIEPFLQGKLGPEIFTLKAQRDQFARYIATRGTDAEVNAVIGRLERAGSKGEESLREIRAQVTQDVLRGASKAELHELEAGGGGEVLQGLPITANRLRRAMDTAYGESPVSSNKRLRTLLGPETYENLKDLIVVETGRAEQSRSGASAGGLMAGNWLNNFLTSARGLSDAGKYAVVSRILSMPGAKKWISGKFARQATTGGHASAIFAGQLATHILKGFVGQEKETVKRVLGISEAPAQQSANLSEEKP